MYHFQNSKTGLKIQNRFWKWRFTKMPETKNRIMILKTRDLGYISESEIRNRRLPKPGIDWGISEAHLTKHDIENILFSKKKNEIGKRTPNDSKIENRVENF